MKRTLRGYLAIGFILTSGFAGLGQSAAARSPERSLTIAIHVYNYAKVDPDILMEAEKVATGILQKAGVKTRWLDTRPALENNQENWADEKLAHLSHIPLILLSRPMAESLGLPGDRLGLAPGEGSNRRQVYVFYHRAEELARQQAEALAQGNAWRYSSQGMFSMAIRGILGHAIAHELGHLLGLDSHSPAGIMRAVWNLTDLQDAVIGNLPFTPQQAKVIRTEVERRNRQDETPAVAQLDAAPMPR